MVSFTSLCVYWKWSGVLAKVQPYIVIASCFLVNLTVGSLYAVGNMIPYVVSYIRDRSNPRDLRLNTVTYIYAAQAVGVGLAMLLGGLLDRFIGPRLVVLLGGLVMTVGALLSYVTIRFSFIWFVFTYGIITGIGLGTLYISPITCSMRWLPKWKGLVSGISLSGIALGTLMYSILQTCYINPHNVRPTDTPYTNTPHEKYFNDPSVLDNVPGFFLILGVTYGTITLIGCIFLVNPSPDYNPINACKSLNSERLPLKDHPPRSASPPCVQQQGIDTDGLTPWQSLRKPNYYLLLLMLTIGQTISSFINPLCKSFGLQEISDSDIFLTTVVSIGAVFNLLGRIIWPLVADLTSCKTVLIFHGAFNSFFLLTFYITTKGGRPMYSIWVCCILFGIGGYVSLFPSAVAKSFGSKNISATYCIMASTALTTGSILAGCISQVMVNVIDWYGTFFVLSAFSCVYFVMALLYRHKTYYKEV